MLEFTTSSASTFFRNRVSMRVVFVTDRRDAHASRFSTALEQSFQRVETVILDHDGLKEVSGTIGGVTYEGWSEIRGSLNSEHLVVVSGPLDSVTANLVPIANPHIGISWATDAMVFAAADEKGLKQWQATVLSLRRVVTDNVATENALISVGVSAESIIRFAWGPDSADPLVRERSYWGFPENGQVGLFGRSLDPHYDPLAFIEVLHLLRDDGVTATWAFLDRGSLVNEVRAELISRGLDENVVWLPPLSPPEFNSLLPSLDCVVSTATTDGTSVTVLEAMRAHVPVVATLTSGSAEWVVNGITGWTCPVGIPLALAKSIKDALHADPSRRSLITTNAFRLVETVGGWNRGKEKLVEAVAAAGGLRAAN